MDRIVFGLTAVLAGAAAALSPATIAVASWHPSTIVGVGGTRHESISSHPMGDPRYVVGKNVCFCATQDMEHCTVLYDGNWATVSLRAAAMIVCRAPSSVKITGVGRFGNKTFMEWIP